MKQEGKHWFFELAQGLRCMALLLAAVGVFALASPGASANGKTNLPKPGLAAAGEASVTTGLIQRLFSGEVTEEVGSAALPEELVPMGKTVGIKLFSDGVLVVGLGQVETAAGNCDPAKDCGLKAGDIITHINAQEVDTIEQVQTILRSSATGDLAITALRGGQEVELNARAVKCSADGSYKLGAWIRDSMAGIGTVTFYDPSSGTFGALGHGISDVDTAQLMPLESGGILPAEVIGVQKGQAGQPGQLRGSLEVGEELGTLSANTASGVFGTLEDLTGLPIGNTIPTAKLKDVHVGEVTILSNISGDEVKAYTAQITRVYSQTAGDNRSFLLKITDPELLEATGGIVQGMSGSPILQDGKLVGAVTHVLVNHPDQGYGISIESMWRAAQSA